MRARTSMFEGIFMPRCIHIHAWERVTRMCTCTLAYIIAAVTDDEEIKGVGVAVQGSKCDLRPSST
jgi:hypothetical protein